jgi:hypothetical protein
MLYLARCRRPHKKNNTNKPQKKTQTRANKQTKLIYMARFNINDAVISFSKHMIHGKPEAHTRAPLPACGKLFALYDCNEQTKPFLSPEK